MASKVNRAMDGFGRPYHFDTRHIDTCARQFDLSKAQRTMIRFSKLFDANASQIGPRARAELVSLSKSHTHEQCSELEMFGCLPRLTTRFQ